MELQTKNQDSTKIEQIGKQLFKLNLIVEYPYSDELIEFMSKTLLNIFEDLKEDEVKKVINLFILGERTYSKTHGITKIIREIKMNRNQSITNPW